MDEFLKTLVDKYKGRLSHSRIFSGYDINVDNRNQIKKETDDYLDKQFQVPDTKSKEYHDFYKEMLLTKEFAKNFYNYFDNLLAYLPKPEGTEVYCSQRD